MFELQLIIKVLDLQTNNFVHGRTTYVCAKSCAWNVEWAPTPAAIFRGTEKEKHDARDFRPRVRGHVEDTRGASCHLLLHYTTLRAVGGRARLKKNQMNSLGNKEVKQTHHILSPPSFHPTRTCPTGLRTSTRRFCPSTHDPHTRPAVPSCASVWRRSAEISQTYEVGGRHSSESMRSQGKTSAGVSYLSCALPSR